MKITDYLVATATLSPCGAYRYTLTRIWDHHKPRVLFVMINPSTADGSKDDHTIRKCVGFARRWGMGSLEVVNLFAYRTKHVEDLARVPDPVGPGNDAAIGDALTRARQVFAAWGPKPGIERRAQEVKRIVLPLFNMHAIKLAVNGEPCHPLTLGYFNIPVVYRQRSAA